MAAGPHGLDGLVDEVIQIPAQHLRPLEDDLPGTAGGKLLVLELFLHRFDLQIGHTLGRPHDGRRPDEAGELVGGKEDLLHLMFGLNVHGDAIAMAGGGVDDGLVHPPAPA